MTYLRLISLALLGSTSLLAQKYEVHLSPRIKPGAVYRFTATGAVSREATTAGRVLSRQEFSAECEARAEVLSVDDAGEPVRLAFTISKFARSEGGATTELLKAGSVLLVDGGSENPFSLDGAKIGDDVRETLGVIYSPRKPGAATDDDVFGARETKAVGETWPINSKPASEDLAKSGIEVLPQNLNGRTELVGLDKVGDADCLSIRSHLTAANVAMKNLPNGAAVDAGSVQASFEGCVPIAGSSYRKSAEMTLEARFTVNASEIHLTNKQKVSEIWNQIHK